MAGKKKAKGFETFTSPPGTLVFPMLNTARDYKGDEKFKYKTKFHLTGEAAEDLKRFVDEKIEEGKQFHGVKKMSSMPGATPYGPAVDDEGNEIKGTTRFTFSVNKTTKTRKGDTWDRKPTFFDSRGTPIETDVPLLGSGTVAQLVYQTYCWNQGGGVGLSLQPVSVIIHKLVEYKRKAELPDDFEPNEDGYVAPSSNSDDDDEGDDGDEF